MEYIQHFHHLINSTMGSPNQNLVVVPGQDWKDLPKIMDNLLEDDQFSEELANRQFKFWQHYISKKSVDCYWRYLFRKWAEIQRFTPELKYEDTPYVSFNLMGRTSWDPYQFQACALAAICGSKQTCRYEAVQFSFRCDSECGAHHTWQLSLEHRLYSLLLKRLDGLRNTT